MNLPSLTSDMINNGVAKGDIDYIWSVGFKMLVVAAIGMIGSIGNVYIAAKVAQRPVRAFAATFLNACLVSGIRKLTASARLL